MQLIIIANDVKTNKVKKERYLIRQNNTIYNLF